VRNPKTTCPLCDHADATFQSSDPVLIACPVCGQYEMTFQLEVDRDMRGQRHPYLSAATRKANDSGHRLVLGTDNWREVEEEQRAIRVTEKLSQLLRLVAERSGGLGSVWKVDVNRDYPLIAAQHSGELRIYLEYLAEKGFLIPITKQPDGWCCALSVPGWQEIEPIPAIGGIPGRCFVAMSFDDSLDDAYRLGIKPAILDCQFDPVCLKDISTNAGITDRILSEIRLAQFVVADFTGQRGGVYFESGFARGLGREVIWSCRKDELHLVHFDIKHFGHVLWDDPPDLRRRLAESIRANIIPKR